MTRQSDITDDPNYVPLLNHGFVGLVDHMGDDAAIVQAARVSYGAGTKKLSEDRGLIRYLMRHHHSTPFEMCDIKLHVRAPIFVIRQWQRHRVASVNEESARYSEMTDEFYTPDPATVQPQSADNKQGRVGSLSEFNAKGVAWMMDAAYDHAHQSYKVLLGDRVGADPAHPGLDVLYDPYGSYHPILDHEFHGVARELARSVMPVGAYSEFYWKLNLHNLFNFLRLRTDPHAQYEIRVYADAILDLIQPLYPLAVEAFEDYVRGAVTLSRMDGDLVRQLAAADAPFKQAFQALLDTHGDAKRLALAHGMTLREITDFAGQFALPLG